MYTRLFSLFIIIIVSCFVLASCGSRDPETIGKEETISEKDIPVSLTHAMWELVESGKMTEGQVLVATLQILADEKSVREVFGDKKISMEEGTDLFLASRAYLKHGKDKKARAEIKRLLAILTPDMKKMRKHVKRIKLHELKSGKNKPAKDKSSSFNLISTVYAANADCRGAWNQGSFDYEECFKSIEGDIGDDRIYTVYYPKIWDSSSPKFKYVLATAEAIKETVRVFRGFGDMHDVEFVFTLRQLNDHPTVLMSMSDFSLGDSISVPSCEVHAYPLALEKLSIGDKTYHQVVAHELWHCFEAWNIYGPFARSRSNGRSLEWGGITKWWTEGSAEYFSNVVYPKVNIEHRKKNIIGFDIPSLNHSLHKLPRPYSNFAFFQYLANQPGIGSRGVVRLLQSMPSSGNSSKQAEAVARFKNMPELFNNFGRDYLDGKITDTGGGFIPFNPRFGKRVRIHKPEVITVKASQLHLARRRLSFDGGGQYTLKKKKEGPEGKDKAKEPEDAVWGILPEKVTTGCGKQEYRLLVTSIEANANGRRHRFKLNVEDAKKTETRQAKIDKCLVGTWAMKNPSHDDVVKSAISRTGMFTNFQSSGKQVTHFTKGCKATLTLKDYKTTANISLPMIKTKTTTTVNGTDTADYIAAGGVITFSNWKQGMCDRMDTKGRVRISRRKGWRNIHTTITECGPYAKGKNAGKRQTTGQVGGKSYDIGKMQKSFDMNKFFKFREQQRKKMRESGFDPNKFLAKYGKSPRPGGYGRNKKSYKMPMPNMGMPMGQAEKEDSLFMGKVAYKCSSGRLTMRAIEPTTSGKSWVFRRVGKR